MYGIFQTFERTEGFLYYMYNTYMCACVFSVNYLRKGTRIGATPYLKY